MLAVWTGCAAWAQFSAFFGGGRRESMPEIKGTVRLEPAEAVVGTPCEIVVSLDGGESTLVLSDRLPHSPVEGMEELDSLGRYKDGTWRLPVRFSEPTTNLLHVVAVGEQAIVRGQGTAFTSTFRTDFQKRFPPLRLNVRPLPESGRPQSFAGAVGTKFAMTQKLVPDHVHPGDLVTATYELRYDGYCPSNAWPLVEHLSKEFKAYEPKEVDRGPGFFKWTQVLVPRTTAATNSALVSLSYYNPRTRRYEFARAWPKRLVFVSDKAASTENTSVVIAEPDARQPEAAGTAGDAPLVLRFAPSDASPVVATLPPGTPARELAKSNGWRRLETPRAVGWSR